MSTDLSTGLLSSIASDVKNYDGKDPLRPWLQGIKKMHACLPPHLLHQKLPRFLQRCVQTFQSDRRYRNDSRYVGVWIQLMDFVEDPKALLRMMERSQIGARRAAFYMAYAIFHEKKKNFEEAERMYHLGVRNLAEPASELQKAYDQFLYRLDVHKKRKAKTEERREKLASLGADLHMKEMEARRSNSNGSAHVKVEADNADIPNQGKFVDSESKDSRFNRSSHAVTMGSDLSREVSYLKGCGSSSYSQVELVDGSSTRSSDNTRGKNPFPGNAGAGRRVDNNDDDLHTKQSLSCNSDDTVVVKFVGSAIVGKSDAEDACHHGLVDPTINMKEAINAISNMFREPLDVDFQVKRKAKKSNLAKQSEIGLQVFVDDNSDQVNFHNQIQGCATENHVKISHTNQPKSSGEAFKILADDEEDDALDASGNKDCLDFVHPTDNPAPPISFPAANVTQKPSYIHEDTIIRKFVGSTIHDEPEVENACHHGLVDPTVNLKEAMDAINNMFGEPIDFTRPRRREKTERSPVHEQGGLGFSILADEDMEEPPKAPVSISSSSFNSSAENDLFEPTICTKEAMAEINAMFGMPMDF